MCLNEKHSRVLFGKHLCDIFPAEYGFDIRGCSKVIAF
jgi:hypothetical protein